MVYSFIVFYWCFITVLQEGYISNACFFLVFDFNNTFGTIHFISVGYVSCHTQHLVNFFRNLIKTLFSNANWRYFVQNVLNRTNWLNINEDISSTIFSSIPKVVQGSEISVSGCSTSSVSDCMQQVDLATNENSCLALQSYVPQGFSKAFLDWLNNRCPR